jgi:hypothetical protein
VAVPVRVWSLLASKRSPKVFDSYQHPLLAGFGAMKLAASKEAVSGAKEQPFAGLDAIFKSALLAGE